MPRKGSMGGKAGLFARGLSAQGGGFLKCCVVFILFLFAAINAPQWYEDYLIHKVSPSIVKLTSVTDQDRGGTGFLIETPQGPKLLSNGHICKKIGGSYALAHYGDDNRKQIVRVERLDDIADLCLLSPPSGLSAPALRLASSAPQRGDTLFTIGYPLLEPQTFSKGRLIKTDLIAIATGYIGPLGCPGPLAFSRIIACMHVYIATKTTINIYPGNSGSPVFNQRGQVVGVVFAGNSETHHGILVPLEDIERFIAGE